MPVTPRRRPEEPDRPPTPPLPFAGIDRDDGARHVAEAAHDFNNILSVILSCASELGGMEIGGAARDRVAEVEAAARRGSVLVRELVDGRHATPAAAEPPLEIGAALEATRPLLQRALGPRIELDLERQVGVPRVAVGVPALERALLNLASNARDAMPGGGRAVVSAARAEIGSGDPALAPGYYAVIGFTDTGPGMEPGVLRRAGRRGFTTKGPAGSGVGLATVAAFAQSGGGEMRIASSPGAGTSVAVYLQGIREDGTPLALGRRC